jgi:hypothetical protein
MKRLSIAAIIVLAGCVQQQQPVTNLIPRPAPDDPTPSGIAYLCDGRKGSVGGLCQEPRLGDARRQDLAHGVPADQYRLSLHGHGQRMDGQRRPRDLARIRGQRTAARLQLPAEATDVITASART